ncbi:hypothetical protein DAPPUDRAFT_244053 [Daphnia pulex]|uniref:Uncharacterized protein n=1 Tax=Daphnia pulex TaxID=6669 RepID=E9GK22_DAPPU|nr:hypothetical protein DAPPUDRAFT_244053 [Daphnia pulex]|eukprot:EFX80225.1 hypothetical protein DAPPUDRAFT_244053 [Daphnia pulex]
MTTTVGSAMLTKVEKANRYAKSAVSRGQNQTLLYPLHCKVDRASKINLVKLYPCVKQEEQEKPKGFPVPMMPNCILA